MSNSQVGGVYQQIINDVIAASRVDFEEGGIDEAVLEQLKMGWQRKLSQQQLAVFPWDPRPDPPPAPATAPAPQSNPGPSASLPTPNGNGYAQQQPPAPQAVPLPLPAGQSATDTRIKTEPAVKIEPGLDMSQSMGGDPNNIAQQRVIAQLQNQYGDRAAASINKLREQPGGGVAQPQNQQRMANPSMPQGYPAPYQNNGQQPQQPQQPQQQQYRPNPQHNPATQQQQQQRAPVANGQRPPNSQLDGAIDDGSHIGILLQQGHNGETMELGQVEIDGMLHAQIAAKAKAMEGGGLMLPLKRARKDKAVSYHKHGANVGPSQLDGLDDEVKDEDDVDSDEDAINSDLDDPDDVIDENEDDDDNGQIMLCMYDKVQRVKNKWKCVLKDGVLNVNGKDYVFHKATGEYEW